MTTNNVDNPAPNKIFLWMNPRTLSTSFEKCIAFMDGAQVWHEPYITCYFNLLFNDPETFKTFPKMKNFAKQFDKAKKLLECEEKPHLYEGGNLIPAKNFSHEWVAEQIGKPLEEGKKFMFIKDAGFAIDGFYDKLPKGNFKHTFIIRNTRRQALSARRLFAHLVMHEGSVDDFDMGTGHPFMAWEKLSPDPLFKLWNYVRENIDPNPIVIDADDLQNHPEQIIKKYCEGVGIPFKKEYLQWDASDEPLKYFYGCLEQMVWGKNEGVYDAAFLSSCFQPVSGPVPETIPGGCIGYEKEFREGYEIMYETRIKPE